MSSRHIYEKALQFIKIRPHHSQELVRKLSLRGFAQADINEALGKLITDGLINNEQFAQNYLDSLIRYKTFGFYGIKAKLMQRGVTPKEAENLLSANFPLDDERQIAQRVVERDRGLDKVKLAQKLQRKGFRNEVISQIIRDS